MKGYSLLRHHLQLRLGKLALALFISTTIASSTDLDNDGLNDQWQQLYYIEPFSGAEDYDLDGRINLVESINFSDPWEPQSGLGLVSIHDMNPADGMDDLWQQRYGISSTDALHDPDNDGRKNIEEAIVFSDPFLADTPWRRPDSASTPLQAIPSSFGLSLPYSIPTTRYRLQSCTDMTSWMDVPGALVWANGEPISHTVDTTGESRRFFRYVLDWPDEDADGLQDWYEVKVFTTSPTTADSDADGWDDGEEVASGSNPGEWGDTPADANEAYVTSRLSFESQSFQSWDVWAGMRWQPPDPGPEEWFRSHYWRIPTPMGIDEGQTPPDQQLLQGSWSLPDLAAKPTTTPPAELPWDPPETLSFADQFGFDYTPYALDSSYTINLDTFKTARWDLEWKRFRLRLSEPLPHDVRKVVKVRKKTFSFRQESGWTESPSIENTQLTLTILAGNTVSDYTYLLPTAGSNEMVEYWVAAGGDGIQLLTVGFKDEEYNTQSSIKSDDGVTVYSDSVDGMGEGQWIDADGDHQPNPEADPTERNWPLAFQAGSTMSLHAQIAVPELETGTPVVVEAKRSGFVKVRWEVTSTGDLVELPRQASSIALPNSVQCFSHHAPSDAFSVDWSIKIGSQAVQKIGKTHHTLYSILKHTSIPKEETLYALACRGAVGRTTANYGLVSSVFHGFTDREVCLVKPTTAEEDGTPMTYRHDSTVSIDGEYSTLLNDKKGRCGHWSDLFSEVLSLHGIYPFGSNNSKKIGISLKDPAGVMAAYETAWADFNPGSTRPFAEPVMFIRSWLIDEGEFTAWTPLDETGIPAQGNNDPSSIFRDHALNEYAGIVFDPSYGATHTSYGDWEANAVDYFGVAGPEAGSTFRMNIWAGVANSSARETVEEDN